MNRLDNDIYTHEQMDRILKSNRSVKYKYELLDKNEIAIKEISATGSINFNSTVDIMGGANFEVNERELDNIDLVNARIKPYMSVLTRSGYVDYPLGIYLVSAPSRVSDGISVTRSLNCYDKSLILDEDKFVNRYFIARGQVYTNVIIELLESVKIFNHDITSSMLTANVDIEFEIGTSKLEAINTLLKSINYTPLWFDMNGYARSSVYVSPNMRNEEYSYVTDNESIVFVGANQDIDTFNVPNVIIRYTDNPEGEYLYYKYVNDNPSSKLSTISRGRNVVDCSAISDIANQSTLEQYVKRLVDESSLYETISFDSAVMPHHDFCNCLRVENKELGLNSTYIEYDWEIELFVGGKMNHKCKRMVTI